MPSDAKTDSYPRTINLPDGQAVQFRLMTPADRDAMLKFARALPQEDLLFLRVDITDPAVVDDWIQNTQAGLSTTLLACDPAGAIVGYATVHRTRAPWTRRVGELRVNVGGALSGPRPRPRADVADFRSGARARSAQADGEHDDGSTRCAGGVPAVGIFSGSTARGLCRGPQRDVAGSRHDVVRHRRSHRPRRRAVAYRLEVVVSTASGAIVGTTPTAQADASFAKAQRSGNGSLRMAASSHRLHSATTAFIAGYLALWERSAGCGSCAMDARRCSASLRRDRVDKQTPRKTRSTEGRDSTKLLGRAGRVRRRRILRTIFTLAAPQMARTPASGELRIPRTFGTSALPRLWPQRLDPAVSRTSWHLRRDRRRRTGVLQIRDAQFSDESTLVAEFEAKAMGRLDHHALNNASPPTCRFERRKRCERRH